MGPHGPNAGRVGRLVRRLVVDDRQSLEWGVPATATAIDLDISFDGYNLYDGGGSAVADTNIGEYGLAIAYGDSATAIAGGTGGFAVAGGSDAAAFSGGGIGDVAEAVGTNADAWAGAARKGLTGADYDTAIDIGNNASPCLRHQPAPTRGTSDLAGGTDGGTGVHDTAIDIGNNSGGVRTPAPGRPRQWVRAVTTTPPSTSATTAVRR